MACSELMKMISNQGMSGWLRGLMPLMRVLDLDVGYIIKSRQTMDIKSF